MAESDQSNARRSVGRNRDPQQIATMLTSGSSVVLTGCLGSGKSHLVRGATEIMISRGVEPIVIRAETTLPDHVLGTSAAARSFADPSLRHKGAGPPRLVVVDDAEQFDLHSIGALIDAVRSSRITALFSVRAPRAGVGKRPGIDSAAALVMNLCSQGAAKRVDLDELQLTDAESLMDLFPGTDVLDAVARATVISQSDGSRDLLWELSGFAVEAAEAGRDPLLAIRDIRPHTRVGDALAAHVGELADDDRHALAFLGLVPHIAYTDAIRLLANSVVDDLLSAGLVRGDGSAHERLTANACLAREAARGAGADVVDEMARDAERRMISDADRWWSRPIAAMIAARWHGGAAPVCSEDRLSRGARGRVALDAARLANDEGKPALAIAFAGLADDERGRLPRELERKYAEAHLGTADDPGRTLAEIDPLALDDELLRRYLRMRAHIVARVSLTALRASGRTDNLDAQSAAEFELAAAEGAVCAMEWNLALKIAENVRSMRNIRASSLLTATLIAALSSAHLGEWSDARSLFESARLAMVRPEAAAFGRTESLLALCVEQIACAVAGAETPHLSERLHTEIVAAADHGGRAVTALAGFCTALAYANAEQADHASRELSAAIHRYRRLPQRPYIRLMEIAVAQSLALLGRPREGQAIIEWSEAGRACEGYHAQMRTKARLYTLVASGEESEALSVARAAATVAPSPESVPSRIRDLFDLAALGGRDPELLRELETLAKSADLPCAPVLSSFASDLFHGRKSAGGHTPLEIMRRGALWREHGPAAPVALTPSGPAMFAARVTPNAVHRALWSDEARGALSRREREIAELVRDGLSNREIAERLFLSVRTVESHVYQARPKIGARSRADFGRAMAMIERDVARQT